MPDLGGIASADLIVHLGYFLVLCALLARDMLWLRSILMIAQGCFVGYGLIENLPPILIWNALFFVINIWMVVRILHERRRIVLPVDLTEIYEHKFGELTRQEFRRLWKLGAVTEFEHGVIWSEGDESNELLLILSGEIHILRRGTEIARLGPGSFVGEMSFLSKKPASAEAVAEGPVRCMTWHKPELWQLREKSPDLLNRLQQALSRELSEKLERS